MAKTKALRSQQRQLGQFMTPTPLADRIVSSMELDKDTRILEPSFGDGSFLIPLVHRLMSIHSGSQAERLEAVLTRNLYGIEVDPVLRDTALERLTQEFGPLPVRHNLLQGDFFGIEYFQGCFDLIIGNPPYGGTFDPDLEDRLDRLYGYWCGHKLKKETYSFFIARSLDWLAPEGSLVFITSDTFLTIKTMGGLRRKLMDLTKVRIESLESFSEETAQSTLVLHARNQGKSNEIVIDGDVVNRDVIELTGNFSWRINDSMAHYFRGPTLSQFVVATSGMTIGRNSLFLREIDGNSIVEPYLFSYFDDPVTLEKELAKARLHKLSHRLIARIQAEEASGKTQRNVRFDPLLLPETVTLPDYRYRYYNKASSEIVYALPRWAVYWQDEGDAVLTFKTNGPWYLHGVGGQPYFKREGLTWALVSSRLNMRYLPEGYILDSGAPCLFLKEGVDPAELWFILGWCLTDTATWILKTALNHTRNIQSKDVERLPYPYWVDQQAKLEISGFVECMVRDARNGVHFARNSPEVQKLEVMFRCPEPPN